MRRLTLIIIALLVSSNIVIESQNRTSGSRNERQQRSEQTSNRPQRNHSNSRPIDKDKNDSPKNKPGNNSKTKHNSDRQIRTTPVMCPARKPLPPPPHYNYRRPPRPRNWHYISGAPSLGQIIGITLGSAFVTTIDNLTGQGIAYTPYGDNTVSVTNVSQFGYIWPRATLYYTDGLLAGGEFNYYSHSAIHDRYTQLNNRFTSQWGYPASVSSTQATWFTPDNGFVTLDHTYSSPYGYVTTLTLGH